MKPLRAFYYPYSQVLNPDALKRALLVFDELWLSDPLEPDDRQEFFIRDRLMHHEDRYFAATGMARLFHREDPALSEEYNQLVTRGTIRRYDATPLIQKHDKALGIFLQADLQDPVFIEWHNKWLEWVDGPHGPEWSILRDRIPESVLDVLSRRSSTDLDWLFTQDGLFYLSKNRTEVLKKIEKHYSHDRVLNVPTVCASSLLINEALLAADKEDLHLFTDSAIHHTLLSAKLTRAAEEAVAVPPAQRTIAEKLVHQLIATTFLDAVIPTDALANVGLLRVVAIREQLRSELDAFREHVASLQSAIGISPFNAATAKQVRELVDKTLVPDLRKLEKMVKNDLRQSAAKVATRVAAAVTPTMLITALSGLTSGQVLGYASAAAAGAFGVAVPEIVELWQKRSERSMSPLAFALRLKDELRKTRV